MALSLEQHAQRIEDAINDAFADGFFLDDGDNNEVNYLELNAPEFADWAGIEIPQ